jgi:hypothetical protein
MPEISRFFGIIIRMFAEPAVQHHRPHFHAYYQDSAAVFAFDSVELLGGELPQRQRRLVEAWAEIHRAELLEDWQRLQAGRPPFKIEPLR